MFMLPDVEKVHIQKNVQIVLDLHPVIEPPILVLGHDSYKAGHHVTTFHIMTFFAVSVK